MPNFKIPNEGDAFNVNQAEPDSRDIDILAAGFERTGVLTGCAVTTDGVGMNVDIASGTISYQNDSTAVTVTGGNVTIEASHPTLPRFDLVMVNDAGALVAPVAGDGKGTAAAEPVFPTIPANRVVLAAVYIPAAVTAILSTYLIDKRVMLIAILTDDVLSGTFAAKPAAATAGRIYIATDTKQEFADIATTWRHVGGEGVYDGFERGVGTVDLGANATTLSGHTWIEDSGNFNIIDDSAERALTPTASQSKATLDTGAPLVVAHYGVMFKVDVATALDLVLILRFVDTSNFLCVRVSNTTMRIARAIANVTPTDVDTVTLGSALANGTFHLLEARVRGPVVLASLRGDPETGTPDWLHHSTEADTWNPSTFKTATKAGLGTITFASNPWIAHDFFCTPGA